MTRIEKMIPARPARVKGQTKSHRRLIIDFPDEGRMRAFVRWALINGLFGNNLDGINLRKADALDLTSITNKYVYTTRQSGVPEIDNDPANRLEI